MLTPQPGVTLEEPLNKTTTLPWSFGADVEGKYEQSAINSEHSRFTFTTLTGSTLESVN